MAPMNASMEVVFTLVLLLLALLSVATATDSLGRSLQLFDRPWTPGNFGRTLRDADGNRVEVNIGIDGRPLAYAGKDVILDDGSNAGMTFHHYADGGQTFAKEDGTGYYYLSNSEDGYYPEEYRPGSKREIWSKYLVGGVYRLEFNNDHEFIGYKQMLSGTAANCGAGRTPWGTYISCEEALQWGQCWQVDPEDQIEPEATSVTDHYGYPVYGNWEAFVFYEGHGYTTDDDYPYGPLRASWNGALARYTPDETSLECLAGETKADKWCALNSGTYEFLRLDPDRNTDMESGTFEWVSDIAFANAELYEGGEGIDAQDGVLVFTAKYSQHIFFLNLEDMTYTRRNSPFENEQPDNIRIMGDAVWMCQDGGAQVGAGIWVRDLNSDSTNAAQVLSATDYETETAGIDFSPDRKVMYVSFQEFATWQFWREDGMPFYDLPRSYQQHYGLRDWYHDRTYDHSKVETKEDMVAIRGSTNTEYAVKVDTEGA